MQRQEWEKITRVFRTSETYHLAKENKPLLHNLLFTESGKKVEVNKIPRNCFSPDGLKFSLRAATSGTQVSRLGAPMFCIQQHPGLLEDADEIVSSEEQSSQRKTRQRELTKVLRMRNFREHWPSWFCD